MRAAFLAMAFATAAAPALASAAAREIVCYAGAREVFRGKNDASKELYYRGNAVTFVDAADHKWKTFPSCSMIWEVKP